MTILLIALALLALTNTVNCQKCPQNCIQCTDNNSCTECLGGFYNGYLYDDKRFYRSTDCSLPCNTSRCETCVSYRNCTKCKAGYCNSGDQRSCRNRCNKNCIACSSCDYCTACIAGYYGRSCNMSCAYGCLDGKCDTQSGSCRCINNFEGVRCDRCISGRFGSRCQQKCSRGCSNNSCDRNGICMQGCKTGYTGSTCDSCKNGFYGNECKKCPKNCLTCPSATRCSECRKGFSGSTCEMSCPLTCTHCVSNGKCSACVPGFYGLNCSSNCPTNCADISCDQTGGYCHKCKSGFWGNSCNVTCGAGCSQNECNMVKGICLNGCNMGFTGVRCEICEDGFFGQMCSPCPRTCTKCASETECSRCSVGFYGQTCSQKCSENCDKGLCFRENGTCRSCKDGFYGDRCEFTCPTNCARNTCNLDGKCYSCKDGYYGENCDKQCSRQCKGSCKRFSGECNHCIDGFFGNDCNENCPKDCINCTSNTECKLCKTGKKGITCQQDCSNCRPGTQCRKSDGYCNEACADGFYGLNCNISCAVRCKTCHRYLHYQCTSCPYGKYGKHGTDLTCHMNCREECLNKSCNEQNGYCLSGCKSGYWGMTCDRPCPKTCKNRFCSMQSGLCLDGCIEGYFGDRCTYMCSTYDQHCQICGSKANFQYDGCKICNAGYFPSNELNIRYKRCIPCPLQCNENNCSSETGSCLHGCKTGHWGETCNALCASTCKMCNQQNGKCLTWDCSPNCVSKECNWSTGHCSSACVDGYFGSTCNNSCSKHCKNSSCSKNSGECNYGCIDGYDEPLCLQEVTGSVNTNIIISIVTGVVGLVAVCVLVVVSCIKHHRRKKEKQKEDISAMKSRTENEDFVDERDPDRADFEIKNFDTACLTKEVSDAEDNKFGPRAYVGVDNYEDVETEFDETTKMGAVSYQEDTYYNAGAVLRQKIELDKLKEFVSKKSKDDFIAEFKELPVGLIKSYEASQKMENRAKNRYRGIYPYDGRRVVIKNGRSDYINASYIDGYMKKNAYIASTGPTIKHMGEDFAIFWEMVWQEHVSKIIMLTKLVELGVWKCDQYWPSKGSFCIYGNVVVICRKENIQKNFTIRIFDIENLKYQKERRTLYQMHFTSWPDIGIPASVALFTEFHDVANDESIADATDDPVLVHCSAGVGRTGTYIALDILTAEGRAEGFVDIFARVRNLREERVNMVQTLEQYVYIHKCLVENLTQNEFKPKQMTV